MMQYRYQYIHTYGVLVCYSWGQARTKGILFLAYFLVTHNQTKTVLFFNVQKVEILASLLAIWPLAK